MNILRIEIVSEYEYNVFFEQDGSVCVDQSRDTPDIQRFNFADITALVKSDPTIVNRPLPVPPLTEEDRQAYKSQAEAWLTPRRHAGFPFDTYKVSGDAEAQANFGGTMTLIQMGVPGPFLCRDTTNVDHMLTAEEIGTLVLTMAQFIQYCYTSLWTCKAEIDSAVTIEDCTNAMNNLQGA